MGGLFYFEKNNKSVVVDQKKWEQAIQFIINNFPLPAELSPEWQLTHIDMEKYSGKPQEAGEPYYAWMLERIHPKLDSSLSAKKENAVLLGWRDNEWSLKLPLRINDHHTNISYITHSFHGKPAWKKCMEKVVMYICNTFPGSFACEYEWDGGPYCRGWYDGGVTETKHSETFKTYWIDDDD